MSNNITHKLAKKIGQLGNTQGFTVNSLSTKSHVSERTIRRILNARRETHNPTLGTLTKLAKAFKLPLDQFMNFSATRT